MYQNTLIHLDFGLEKKHEIKSYLVFSEICVHVFGQVIEVNITPIFRYLWLDKEEKWMNGTRYLTAVYFSAPMT